MNAQAPLPKPNDLKISCVLTEVIGLAETDPKDSRDLFDGVGTLNILLLVLNFFSYVGLLRGEKSTEKSVAIAAAGFITLMAFVFNTCVAGIPTPLRSEEHTSELQSR